MVAAGLEFNMACYEVEHKVDLRLSTNCMDIDRN